MIARRMESVWERVKHDYEQRPKMPMLSKEAPIVEALVASWKRRGLTGVLLEAPDNPKYDEVKGGMQEVYRREMPLFAARLGVEYWDLNPEVGLKATDFIDHVHLFDRAARFKFQAAFVRRLAQFMKPMAHPAPGAVIAPPPPPLQTAPTASSGTGDASP